MIDNLERFKNWRWWTVALRGVAAIIFGIIALASPGAAWISLVILFGVYAIADGILAFGLGRTTVLPAAAMYGRGAVSIAAGLLALLLPSVTALALVLLIGTWAIISGILEIAMAIRARHVMRGEWMLGLEGALSIVFGVLLFAAPLAGAIVLGVWIGAYALIVGGMMVATGFRLRALEHAPLAA